MNQLQLLSVLMGIRTSIALHQAPGSSHQPESFCRDDYLIALNEYSTISSRISVLSTSTTEDSSGKLRLRKGKVFRQELFRFEAHDLTNEQWVIRTWDGRPLAIDQDGSLTVKVVLSLSLVSMHLNYIHLNILFRVDVLLQHSFDLFYQEIF
jgi:hypothetical protein